ncbi:MAG: hypothetical protein ACK57N_01045 [Planctomycetia bacterium]
MKNALRWIPASLLLLAAATYAVREPTPVQVPKPAEDAASATVAPGVLRLVAAAPFELQKPYDHVWRVEAPQVWSGWLVALEADPALCAPRQTAEPVLVAGLQTAARVNHGALGRVVAVLPCDERLAGAPCADLARTWWWSAPALPEQLDEAALAAARAALPRGAIHAVGEAEWAAARARGGEAIQVLDETELWRVAAAWILEHAPEDRETAQGLLVPLEGR